MRLITWFLFWAVIGMAGVEAGAMALMVLWVWVLSYEWSTRPKEVR